MRVVSISSLIASSAILVLGANAASVPFPAGIRFPFIVPRGGAEDDSPATNTSLKDMMKEAGVDSSQLDELMKNMPGGGEGMPSMEESMSMMSEMVNSPMFNEYMNDPEKLEQSRKMILENPMMKQMMAGMPGMEEILNDPEKWRQTMQSAGEMYKSMAAGGGLADMMGAVGGGGMDDLLDGAGTLGGNDALDELSEGED